MRKGLADIQAPALLVYSKDDPVVTPEEGHMELIFQSLASQEKQSLWIEKSGHVVTRDAQRQQVFQAIGFDRNGIAQVDALENGVNFQARWSGKADHVNGPAQLQPLQAAGVTVPGRGGPNPAYFAGHSLGEYTALYEAGVIRLEDLFPIVKTRGLLMEKASRGADTAGGRAGMAAVIIRADSSSTRMTRRSGLSREARALETSSQNSPRSKRSRYGKR